MAKQKRRVFRLMHKRGRWILFAPDKSVVLDYGNKARCEREARFWCRAHWEKYGVPTQLLIYRRDGRIGTGNRAEASYGCDSEARG